MCLISDKSGHPQRQEEQQVNHLPQKPEGEFLPVLFLCGNHRL